MLYISIHFDTVLFWYFWYILIFSSLFQSLFSLLKYQIKDTIVIEQYLKDRIFKKYNFRIEIYVLF
jgi:hypothetical protein